MLNAATEPHEIQQRLNQTVIGSLKPIALVLCGYYLLLSVSHALVLPPPINTVMATVAGGSAVFSLALWFALRAWPLRAQHAHTVLAIQLGLTLLNSLLHLYLTQEPQQTTNVMLVVVTAGLFFLSTPWIAFFFVITLCGWAVVVASSPSNAAWVHFGFGMFSAYVLSLTAHLLRVRSHRHIERLRLQDTHQKAELQQRANQMETSIRVGQSITSLLDLDTLLHQVAELIKSRYGYTYVGIFLHDENTRTLIARAGTGQVGRALIMRGTAIPFGRGIIGWVGQQRRPACVGDTSRDPRFVTSDLLLDTRAELALPLMVGERLLGVLDMQSDRVGAFREEEVPVLQLLADQVAIAIQNASLYQTEKYRRQLAETLYNVGRALSRTLDKTEVLELILQQLGKVVQHDRGLVLLRQGNVLTIVAARGFNDETMPLERRIPIRLGDVFDEICRTQRPLVIPDVLKRADWQHMKEALPARSWLGVPLIHEDQVNGMLSLARETYAPYTEDEITFAATFAGQAMIALENARLYEQISRFNQELEAMVAQRTEALQQAYDRLEKMDRAKSDFIEIVSHELRTPLTTMRGYGQMLTTDALIAANAYHHQLADGIYQGTLRLHQIVDSMLDVAKIDNRALKLHLEPVALAQVLDGVTRRFTADLKERRITLHCADLDALPAVQADPDALHKVFTHLIVNAIKYTPDGGGITVSGEVARAAAGTPEAVEIVVADAGIGIAPEMLDLIFVKFFQTGQVALHSSGQTKFKGGGPGLGLAIARGIIEAHGGRIWAESAGCDEVTCPGSRFHVILPLKYLSEN